MTTGKGADRKKTFRRLAVGALALVALLAIAAALVLPRLVDAESYRGVLRSNLERELGRPVEFGAMKLSLWPVLGLRLDDLSIGRTPDERFDTPVTAESLRVGARIFPLLKGRLEVTSLIVEGPVVTLYGREDGTWEPGLTAGGDEPRQPPGTPGTTPAASALVIEQLRLTRGRVVLRREVGGQLREVTLDDLELTLDGVGTDGPLSFELSSRVGGSGAFRGSGTFQPPRLSTRIEVEGLDPQTVRGLLSAVAPTMTMPEDLLADRTFSVNATVDYDAGPPARLAVSDAVVRGLGLRLVRSPAGSWNYEARAAETGAPAAEPGEAPNDTSIVLTDVTIEDASVRIEDRSTGGDPSIVELMPVRLSLAQSQADAPIAISLDAEGAAGTLALRGSVNVAGAPAQVDLELLPSRLAVDDVAALLALAVPDAPLTFASPDPIELELRVRGPLAGDALPDVEGSATLSRFTIHVAGMSQPMENVGAKVTFAPDRITLDDLGAVVGTSDVIASRVVVSNFEAPKVRVELNSKNADFWELFSIAETAASEAGSPTATTATAGPLDRLTIEGTLRIERGSLQTLAFEKLAAGMNFRDGVVTLTPLEMDLYGGRFVGSLTQDLNSELLTITGKGDGVDVDGFLSQNLQLGGLVSGKATTDLDILVRASDPADVLAGVSGGGPLQLIDGRLAKLDVLKSLTKVTGIFGENSLRGLAKQLAVTGTPFTRAEGRLNFDAGTLNFEDLLLETNELTLSGRAALGTTSGALGGRFQIAFSPELSASMRTESSRAASLFWDPKTARIAFTIDVAGSATAPRVKVDWDSALRGVAERKLSDKLLGILGGKPQVQAPGETADPIAPAEENGFVVEITRTRWSGPVLLRDLSLEGTVRGGGIERAALAIVDARGATVHTIDRLQAVDDQLAALEDRDAEVTLSWSAKVDGKRLLAARFPVTVNVTAYDRDGGSASASRDVER